MADQKEFTLEDILAEQRQQREQPAPAPQSQPQPTREESPTMGVSDDTADLNAFATGSISIPGVRTEEQSAKKEKKKKGLFGRKKRTPDFDEREDMYYGIQLKPIDEYRKGFDPTGEVAVQGKESFRDLFDDSKIDEEVEQNFQRLQKERRRRVAEAVQTAGVDEQQIADEFGVVAPMPVSSFSADPHVKQHGLTVEGGAGEVSELQRAMMESQGNNTMEIKLNVLSETMELQRVKEVPAVSDETVSRILEAAEQETPEALVEEQTEAPAAEQPAAPAVEQKEPNLNRPLGEIPQVAAIYEYRSRSVPTHVINADVLQSALLSESEELKRSTAGGAEGDKPARRRTVKRPDEQQTEEEIPAVQEDLSESIDDYTGPEDARSISHELKSDMHELTMRMMITGACTVLLALVNLIFGGQLSAGGDVGSMPIVYVVLTVVFLGVSIGICYRTVINGLKALLSLNANSDSAVAVAAAAAALQAVASIFFRSDLVGNRLHLYAAVVSAFLFLNSAGKLTMTRRIHSNFRFVSSKEQKYAVHLYEDYNTALKMTKDCVVEKPVVAYQSKTGFLKRFLELSYGADPAETASQTMAPIGLIASLVVCIVCLLISRSVPTALSALAASCCACVAVGNMLAVNLPVSRLCKTARRAGAMVVGYEAVERFGNVNSVIVDAEEIFPRGTVVLNGIKTFGDKSRAEQAIMAASALMKEVGGPLSGVFDQVISENEDSLPEVENISYEPDGGILGRVDGREVAIGGRNLMINRHVEIPAREEESQYASGNKAVVYIAVESAAAAMLVLSYSADRRRRNELQRMEESGISVLVRSTDPNVNAKMIARLFGIDSGSVAVLEGNLADEAQKQLSENVARADAVAATKGRMESLLSILSACVEEKRTVSLLVAIQNAAMVLGFVLVAFLACFGGMRQLSALILFLFEMFWLAVMLILPKLRK